jgi:hypothetical protein
MLGQALAVCLACYNLPILRAGMPCLDDAKIYFAENA